MYVCEWLSTIDALKVDNHSFIDSSVRLSLRFPAGLIFTTLNNQQNDSSTGKQESTMAIIRRVISEKGIGGMYSGGGAMCLRQATNWASRSGFTEIARSVFKLQQFGILGEIASGTIGGVGSCWNTPIETIRVVNHRDVSKGLEPKAMSEYWNDILEEGGYPGLFRGITPRAVQAVWQTVFLVVVPNIMGI
jgi:Mitochondrial carrier protein